MLFNYLFTIIFPTDRMLLSSHGQERDVERWSVLAINVEISVYGVTGCCGMISIQLVSLEKALTLTESSTSLGHHAKLYYAEFDVIYYNKAVFRAA